SIYLYLSATQNAPLRIALQDKAGYTADEISPISVTSVPTLYKVALPGSVFKDYNSTTGCSPSVPCAVDSSAISEIQLLPNPGSAYNGTITIGYIYIGDSATVAGVTAVTSPS